MKNKKASVAVVILVVSVLILSSGLIITNEVKKSNNENNVAGTGLFLFVNEEDNSDVLSDSLGDDTKLFTFGDSGRKSSSKKSSGGGVSSVKESSTVNEESNSLIVPETNETFGNQTIVSNSEEDNLNLSELRSGDTFERDGVKYILRNDAIYALDSFDFYIEFNPALPSKVCENERIDITVRGETQVFCTLADKLKLAFDGHLFISSFLYLMEADFIGDDEIKVLASGGLTYDCSTIYFEETFRDIDLSDEIIPDPGENGEFYAKIEGDKITDRSTTDYDVSVDYDCQCLGGPCCDTSSRPYTYKPSGSQPIGYTDDYYCSGVNSPTGTNYCIERDYYCSGNSAGYFYSDSTIDTCGICEYCTPGDPTCNYYSSSTGCGTKDCDSLDTTCRNYHDVGRYCTGSGSCGSGSCTSYTDAQKGNSCGTNKECDGDGSCITCTTHSSISCSNEDIYWYDLCGNREDKKEECGEFSESGWQNYCVGDDKWKKKTCTGRGCSNNACWENSFDCQETFVETCSEGCSNGACNAEPGIECYQDSDCGTDGYVGDLFCSGDDVYQSYEVYTCHNDGTTSSYCSSGDADILIQDCGEDGSSENYCSDNDVYRNFIDRGCSSGSCFETTTEQKVEDCGVGQCVDGVCEGIEKPDLTVIDLVVQRISGRSVTLAFTVKNIGELVATDIYWMVDTDSADTNPERTVPVILNPDGWTRAYMMWTYSQSGTYHPEVIVDFDNLVSESNENNNRQTISLTV